jgi:hypothetical protein
MLLALLTVAHAADAPAPAPRPARDPRYPAVQIEDFEGVRVEAEIVKPGGILVNEHGRPVFSPFIRVRENWNEELAASVDAVK